MKKNNRKIEKEIPEEIKQIANEMIVRANEEKGEIVVASTGWQFCNIEEEETDEDISKLAKKLMEDAIRNVEELEKQNKN